MKIEESGESMLFNEVQQILRAHKKNLSQFGVQALAIFGSTAKNEGRKDSDVDILIDFDSKKGLFVFLSLKDYLENLLHCKVDLVTKKGLHPALKKRIISEAKQIFYMAYSKKSN